jgi:hypothetical protein
MADGTHPEAVSNNDDLFGESTTAVAEPEQETGIEEPSGEAEAEVATEPDESTEVAEEAEATEAEAQSEADPELDAFLAKKKIDRNKFDDYAERYQITPAMLKANPSLRYLVLDKMNADGELAAIRKPAEEPKKEEPKQQPAAVNPIDHVKQTLQSVSQYNDPQILKAYVDEFSAAGEKGDAVAQFAVLSAAANNLIETRFAQLMESHFEGTLEKKFSGFGQQWTTWKQASEYANAWDAMRQQNSELPESFAEIEQQALARAPYLAKVKDLTPQERLQAYVDLSQGKQVNPETVEKAATKIAEKKLEQKTVAEKAKGLGAGQTKGNVGRAKVTSNDDIFGSPGEVQVSHKLVGKKV